jgi:hypothetical protein
MPESSPVPTLPLERARQLTVQYPEITALINEATHATPERRFTATSPTVGSRLFPNASPKALIEFDRAYLAIAVLESVLSDDYEAVTACQPGAVKLQRRSFDELRQHTADVLPDETAIQAMETDLAINDLGKDDQFVRRVKAMPGVPDTVDHDVLMHHGLLINPRLSPSFVKLPPEYQKKIIDGLATGFNMGQMMQAENVAASLQGLADVSPETRDFHLLHCVYDLAGAAGHAVQNGSVILNEPTARDYRYVCEAIEGTGVTKTADEAYQSFLAKKAKDYGISLDSENGVALTRLASMMRVADRKGATDVRRVFDGLPLNSRAILNKELSKHGTDDGIASLIYYASALLANLQKHAGTDKTSWREHVATGLTTLARIYQTGRTRKPVLKAKGSGVQTILISEIAAAAAADPRSLDRSRISLEGTGMDVTAHLSPVPTINLARFLRLKSLRDLAGDRFAVVGMGGGSDGVQAAVIAQLMGDAGKDCPAVMSIRTAKPQSQTSDGVIADRREVRNHGGEIAEGVYRITTQTTGSGRFLEHLPAGEVPMFMVQDDERTSVAEKLRAVIDHVGGVDAIIGLDTGGDVLQVPSDGQSAAVTTPDQDIRSLQAIRKLAGPIAKYCMIVAPGIDSPDDAEELLFRARAAYFEPDKKQTAKILASYKRWRMDGSDDRYYGKTPLAWQASLKAKQSEGIMTLDLPTGVVIDDRNPWIPYVIGQPAMRGAFIFDLKNA